MKKMLYILIAAALIASPFTAFADMNSSDSESEANANNAQGQQQGQEQVTVLDQLNNSFNSEGKRGFAIAAETNYGPTMGYFVKPLPSDGFQPVEQLLMYNCWFTEGALESMLKGVESADAELKIVNDGIVPTGDAKTKWIKVVISTNKYDAKNVQLIGFMTARSNNKKTTMTEVVAKASLKALQAGCNVIHFTAQGAVRDAFSTGWGIGLSTTQAQIAEGQNHSNVSAGGLGYSSAKAGTRDLPWLQGFALYDPDLTAPVSRADQAKK